MSRVGLFVLLLFASVCVATSVNAGDWPCIFGPDHNAVCSETGIAKEWPEAGPKTLWTISVGPGFAGASIKDGKVYVLDRENDAKDILRCLDVKSGQELWRFAYDAPGRLSYNGSRSVPTVDDTNVYTVGAFGDVYAIDQNTHQPKWHISFQSDYGSSVPNWGYSQSPLLDGDHIIVAPMSSEVGMIAVEKDTGKVVWKSKALGGDAYCSPLPLTILGKKQIVFPTKDFISSIDPDNGDLLWQYDQYHCKIPIPNVTDLGGSKLFVSGGYNAGSVIIQVENDGGKWGITKVKSIEGHGSQIHPVIPYKGHLYANFNTNENIKRNPDGVLCMNYDGEILWQSKDNPHMDRGTILAIDGVILALGGQDGVLYMFEAIPDTMNLLDSALIFKPEGRDSNMWGPMAFSNGLLVLRSQNEMKCLDLVNP